MIPSFENNHTLNNALFIMGSMSPKAKNNLELELYRETADSDGSTQQYILESVFKDLVDDLDNIGIQLRFDYTNTCNEMETLFSFLHLSAYLLPSTLYDFFLKNESLRNLLKDIVCGNLVSHETPLQVWLSELGGLDGGPARVPELTEYIDQIYSMVDQTPAFSDYFRKLHELVTDQKLVVDSSHEEHITYTDFTREYVGRVSDALNLFSDSPHYEEATKYLHFFIRDLTSSENYHDYRYIFTNPRNTIPDSLQERYDRRWYHYHMGNPWFLDYYLIRKTEPSQAIVLMMYSVAYGLSKLLNDYSRRVEKLRIMYPFDGEELILNLYGKGN